eukprot:TRINITY_DN19022_c0_g1_i1.p1 TRINITY_DN19022_c0_g1~~TRINITY_DN19022_c0_g1_i1.p1  ORF type:complete len:184 (-),score=57.52 TRINITY_DN19022_c0_g1_i1:308-859(-)
MADYYDIDAILASEDAMTVQFKHDVVHMGHLNPGCDDPQVDMKEGAKVEVPFWIAAALHSEDAAAIFPPRCFAPKFRDNMEANANTVTLDKFPYYYEIGMHLAQMDPEGGVRASLKKVFAERCHEIFDHSNHMRHVNVDSFTRKLCMKERQLFDRGYEHSKAFESWKKNEAPANKRKRKASEL